jgi:hypothetical protein
MVSDSPRADTQAKLSVLCEKLDYATNRLAAARPFGKQAYRGTVLDVARRVMLEPGGVEAVFERAERLETAGLFEGTDWSEPDILQAALTARTLKVADSATTMLECISELRMLAVAQRVYFHPKLSSEQAQNFLAPTLGLNLDILFGTPDEVSRNRPGRIHEAVRNHFAFIVEFVGYGEILDRLIAEIWRLLAQRPIVVDDIKAMIAQISVWLLENQTERTGAAGWGADRLVSAVFGPTAASREDPGLDAYRQRLQAMDMQSLQQEAVAFSRAMHDTGLASAYHAVFLRHAMEVQPELLVPSLGLSATGADAFRCYSQLVGQLVDRAVTPWTPQAIYGLALMLERGVLYAPPMAPALWRQIGLVLHPNARATLERYLGTAVPAETFLLSGVLKMLGQPLGVGQGNNPTCQAARAMSMWSFTDPDYLLQVIAWAARDDEVIIHFEGQPISSRELAAGLALVPPADVDAVSLICVPHLDRIYAEMGRRCLDRGQDAHVWINPELHGWWVGRGCRIAVDIATGKLQDYDNFLRGFYAAYHPYYNGNQPVIHPQPAGIAFTDSAARFVGWHAIAITRVGLDQLGVMRVYFFNPNNDSGQDWGDEVTVATEGTGERYGESSLPIEQFASRLYLFHFDPLEQGLPEAVPAEEMQRVGAMARDSWAATR